MQSGYKGMLFLGTLVTLMVLLIALPGVAAASKFNIGSKEKEATLTGSQLASQKIQIFFGSSGQVKCETATLSGTMKEHPVETVSLHPIFGTCTGFGFPATVTTSGCNFTTHAGVEGGEGAFIGTLDVVCEAGKSIKMSAGTCELEIKAVAGVKGLRFVNEIEVGDIEVDPFLTELPYTVTKDGAGCPLPNMGNFTNGSSAGLYTITATITGGGFTTFFIE